jgi:anti-sigma regulatory factor (Ser/Thr protein kinase)
MSRRLRRTAIYLMLRMKPVWVFVDELRRFVEAFCASACPGVHRDAQLAMAVHELVQNAVPHADGEEIEVALEVVPPSDRVALAVTNRCTDEAYRALAARIDEMNGNPDALEDYLRAMRASPMHVRGGIGLARVRYEGQLELSVSRMAGRVTVHASGPLVAPPLPVPRRSA